jgi:hypothetical protein
MQTRPRLRPLGLFSTKLLLLHHRRRCLRLRRRCLRLRRRCQCRRRPRCGCGMLYSSSAENIRIQIWHADWDIGSFFGSHNWNPYSSHGWPPSSYYDERSQEQHTQWHRSQIPGTSLLKPAALVLRVNTNFQDRKCIVEGWFNVCICYNVIRDAQHQLSACFMGQFSLHVAGLIELMGLRSVHSIESHAWCVCLSVCGQALTFDLGESFFFSLCQQIGSECLSTLAKNWV